MGGGASVGPSEESKARRALDKRNDDMGGGGVIHSQEIIRKWIST